MVPGLSIVRATRCGVRLFDNFFRFTPESRRQTTRAARAICSQQQTLGSMPSTSMETNSTTAAPLISLPNVLDDSGLCASAVLCVPRRCRYGEPVRKVNMKIVQFREYGGPEVLELVDVPEPAPAPGEILVRAEAIGVGVPDILMRRGTYNWIPPLPVIPGNELAGTVEAVGSGGGTVKCGDRVYVNSRELPQRGGGYTEKMVVPAAAVFAMPDTVSAEQAVALGNYQLAWLLLNYASAPMAGDAVLIHAAAGGAGSALVQMAKRQGLTVYGVAGSPDKVRYVKALGANAVIDRSTEDIRERIAALTGGAGVKFIYDAVGGEGFADNFGMLSPMGMVVSFGQIAGLPDPDILTPMRDQIGNCVALRLFSIHVLDDEPEIRRDAMGEAMKALAAGEIATRIQTRLPLAEAAEAQRLLETGTVTGKIVLIP